MTPTEAESKLADLLAMPAETEWLEFKKAENNFDFDSLGQYFSALSNEANLKSQAWAWLVFGVKDRTHEVLGTNYRPNRPHLDEAQKVKFIVNLLQEMKAEGIASPSGRGPAAFWELSKPERNDGG